MFACGPCWAAARADVEAATAAPVELAAPAGTSWHPEVPPGTWAPIPAWHSQRQWLAALGSALISPAGVQATRTTRIEASTVLLVARAEAVAADRLTGRQVATAHETVARACGVSRATVRRARAVLIALAFEHVVLEGRYLTREERTAARAHHGGTQLRCASVRALSLPARWSGAEASTPPPVSVLPEGGAVDHEHLPRSGSATKNLTSRRGLPSTRKARAGAATRQSRTRTRQTGGNRPPSLELQKLAGRLVQRLPWIDQGHIGAVCTALASAGITGEDWTAQDVLDLLERRNRAAGLFSLAPSAQRRPLALLVAQLREALREVTETPGARRRREVAAAARARAEVAATRNAQAQRAPQVRKRRPFRERFATQIDAARVQAARAHPAEGSR